MTDRLPEPIRHLVERVVAATGLAGSDRVDVTDELVAHFEDGLAGGRSVDDLVEAFGDPEAAARLIARTRLRRRERGGLLRRVSLVSALGRDLRYAVRRLRQTPGFVFIVLLSLAIGIGGNTAMFTLVNAILMQEPPYADVDALFDVYIGSDDHEFGVFSYPDYRDVREHILGLASHVPATWLNIVEVEYPDGSDVVPAELVNGDYFPGLGVPAAVGRTLLPSDDIALGAHPVVVLGHGYWQRVHDGDPAVVGETMRLGGRDFTIVGVAPASFSGSIRGLVPDLFLPIRMVPVLSSSGSGMFEDRGAHSMWVKARLAAGTAPSDLEAALRRLGDDLRARGEWTGDSRFRVIPTADVVSGVVFGNGPVQLATPDPPSTHP